MRTLPLALLLLVGCEPTTSDTADTADTADTSTPATLPDGFEQELTVSSGCGDVIAYASNADDTVGVVIVIADEPLAAAGFEDATTVYTLPDPRFDLRVMVGEHVNHPTCNDALEHETVIEGTWTPTAGTATLTVRPNANADMWPQADLVLEGVTLEGATGGEPVTLEALTWTDVHVGWMPG